jgi:hypothetical protein
MDKAFNTIHTIFYTENRDLLKDISKKEFMNYNKETKKKIADELKLNLKFVLTFGTAITAFFPMVKTFIETSGISDIQIDEKTLGYLSICAIAIALDTPKKEYRQLFTELRMRNVYGLLEKLTYFIKKLPQLFNIIFKSLGKVTYDLIGMFNYTILFVPFILSLNDILLTNTISLENIMNVLGNDPNMAMKLTSIGIGVAGITLREIIVDTIKSIKKFNIDKYDVDSISKKEIKSSLNKTVKSLSIAILDKELDNQEEDTLDNNKIYSWSEWKEKYGENLERVDEER